MIGLIIIIITFGNDYSEDSHLEKILQFFFISFKRLFVTLNCSVLSSSKHVKTILRNGVFVKMYKMIRQKDNLILSSHIAHVALSTIKL